MSLAWTESRSLSAFCPSSLVPASASAGPPPARRHRPHLDPSLVAEPLHPARNWAENTQEQNKLCRLAAQSSIATEQSSRAYLLFPWDKPCADNVTVSRIPIYLHTCHVRPPSQAPFPAVDPRSNPPLPYILSGHPGFAAFACDWTGLDAKIASGEPCSMGHARSLLLAPFDGCNERARSHRLLLPSFSVPAPWRRTGPSQVDDDLYRRTFSSEARSPGALARTPRASSLYRSVTLLISAPRAGQRCCLQTISLVHIPSCF